MSGWQFGKVILVSGGTQGLGKAIALRLAADGAEAVAVSGRHAERGAAVVEEIEKRGSRGIFIRADLAEAEAAIASVAAVIEEFGRIDSLVNCAAVTTRGSFLDTTPELFDQHVNVNLRAPFFTMAETIKHLTSRKAPGNIVNIITMSALGGQPYLAPYVASKAGLIGATKNAAHAHRWDRIRVNGINIGWTATDGEADIQKRFHGANDDWLAEAEAAQPMGKLGQPDEIAEFVSFLLSERSGVVTGSVIDWDQNVPGSYD